MSANLISKKLVLKPQFKSHKQAMTTLENLKKGNEKRKLDKLVRMIAMEINSRRIQ